MISFRLNGGCPDAYLVFKNSTPANSGGRACADPGSANECDLRLHGWPKLQGLFLQRRHRRLRLSELQERAGVPERRGAEGAIGGLTSGEVPRANSGRSADRSSPGEIPPAPSPFAGRAAAPRGATASASPTPARPMLRTRRMEPRGDRGRRVQNRRQRSRPDLRLAGRQGPSGQGQFLPGPPGQRN